jgi:hypothetical protein
MRPISSADSRQRAFEALQEELHPSLVDLAQMEDASQPCQVYARRQQRVDLGARAQLIGMRDAQERGYTIWHEGLEQRLPPEALHVLRKTGRPMGGADFGASDTQSCFMIDVKTARPRKGQPALPGKGTFSISTSAVAAMKTQQRLVPAQFFFELISIQRPLEVPYLVRPYDVETRGRRNGAYWVISATEAVSAETVFGPKVEDPDVALADAA